MQVIWDRSDNCSQSSEEGGYYDLEWEESECSDPEPDFIKVSEGEALRLEPGFVEGETFSDHEFTWYRNDSEIHYLSSDEEERIHHHGPTLLFLPLSINDSGLYIVRWNSSSGECHTLSTHILVLPAQCSQLLYHNVSGFEANPAVPCPDPVTHLCEDVNGSLTWYRNSSLLLGEHGNVLRLTGATKADEATYTCMCTWSHNGTEYNSTASRKLERKEPSAYLPPQIIAPINREHFTDQGSRTKLNCSAFCGKNVADGCKVYWLMDGEVVKEKEGYNETLIHVIEEPSKQSIFTAVLTIERVSAQDFHTKFQCVVIDSYNSVSNDLSLRPKASMTDDIIRAARVLLLCLLAAGTVKYFAIDLALLFRRFYRFRGRRDDGKVYDAYVVYQTQEDKALEDNLSHFLNSVLPSVLEHKCGFKLFIHGRDDLPGEDRLELVEMRMRLSRRLMVILTPGSALGSGSGSEVTDQHDISPQTPVVGGYDWQVGLHQVLVQTEMTVILIQMGDMGPQGFKHLPAGLQHLVRKSAPLRWRQESQGATMWNSRFWKRVRYMMPAAPAKNTPQSIIV
ncbi:interleukin-1 receptor-like 1 [Polymixia lowei]